MFNKILIFISINYIWYLINLYKKLNIFKQVIYNKKSYVLFDWLFNWVFFIFCALLLIKKHHLNGVFYRYLFKYNLIIMKNEFWLND